jgi:hypothetical protein
LGDINQEVTMAKEAKVSEGQVTEVKREVPPVRWNQTVNAGWHISNETFRRVAHTGEFSPKKTAEPKAASPKAAAPSA